MILMDYDGFNQWNTFFGGTTLFGSHQFKAQQEHNDVNNDMDSIDSVMDKLSNMITEQPPLSIDLSISAQSNAFFNVDFVNGQQSDDRAIQDINEFQYFDTLQNDDVDLDVYGYELSGIPDNDMDLKDDNRYEFAERDFGLIEESDLLNEEINEDPNEFEPIQFIETDTEEVDVQISNDENELTDDINIDGDAILLSFNENQFGGFDHFNLLGEIRNAFERGEELDGFDNDGNYYSDFINFGLEYYQSPEDGHGWLDVIEVSQGGKGIDSIIENGENSWLITIDGQEGSITADTSASIVDNTLVFDGSANGTISIGDEQTDFHDTESIQ